MSSRKFIKCISMACSCIFAACPVMSMITGETFLKAMGSVDKFRDECDIRVWLCQIVKNCT